MIQLKGLQPFASGGNRLCFVHPAHSNRCIKIFRADRSPEIRRREKGIAGKFSPLSKFDENFTEAQVLKHLSSVYPKEITSHLPESFGMETTDLGTGHITSLFRDADGLISQSLEQYIYKQGLDQAAKAAISEFLSDWSVMTPKTRDLIPHNFVARRLKSKIELYLIDGLGRPPILPDIRLKVIRRSLYQRRKNNFDFRIQKILRRKKIGDLPLDRLKNLQREL